MLRKKGAYRKRNSPLWRGDLGVCLLVVSTFLSGTLLAQQKSTSPQVLFTNLKNPTSIYATQQHLFVVESGKHRVLKLDHDGNLLETMGGLGTGDYQFDTPIDIDATNGLKIYVSDNRNNRIQVFDRRFQYLTTIKAPEMARNFKPTQLIVNNFGELFVYDESSKALFKFDENGNYLDNYQIPGTITVYNLRDVNDELRIIDVKEMIMYTMSSNGIFHEQWPFFFYDGKSLLDQSFSGNYRFDLYRNQIRKIIVTE